MGSVQYWCSSVWAKGMDEGAMKKARYKDQDIDFVLWDKVDLGHEEQGWRERTEGCEYTRREGGWSVLL